MEKNLQNDIQQLREHIEQLSADIQRLTSDVKIMFELLQTVLQQAAFADPDEIDYAAVHQAKNSYIETHDLLDLATKTKRDATERLKQLS